MLLPLLLPLLRCPSNAPSGTLVPLLLPVVHLVVLS